MKASVLSGLALASGTHALVARGGSCCFGLTANGGPGGKVAQLIDGQNRIGQTNLPTPGKFCMNNGQIIDGQNRGCILTPPTTQLQCDVGAKPDGGFAVGCDGSFTHNGDATFYSCPTGDHDGWNIYTTPVAGQDKCVKITLNADSCHSGCAPPPAPKPTPAPAPSPAPAPASDGCPRDLTGSYEFPHLIVPVDSANPNKAVGTSYFGDVEGTVGSIFNFDIPASDSGKTCTLEFLFPKQNQLQTSSYKFSGSGKVKLSLLDNPATQQTSYSNMGNKKDAGEFTFTPGSATTIATYPCSQVAGKRIGVLVEPVGDTCLNYFQDYNPCPIGMYIQTA